MRHARLLGRFARRFGRSSLALVAVLAWSASSDARQTNQSINAAANTSTTNSVVHVDLVGVPLGGYPWFEFTRAIHEVTPTWMAIDPTRHPELLGKLCDAYVCAHKSAAQWALDPQLSDVRGASQTLYFASNSIHGNTFMLDSGTLNGHSASDLGVGYDVVLDLDRDGRLSAGDYVDGDADEAGFYVVRDSTVPGPHTVVEMIYSGGTWLGQDTFYPADIASLRQVPLVVISHGNGHNYTWYDHIGKHLASWGCIVMSHTNNTGPGIETASTTTLTNTDYILANQATIGGGVLDGHIDGHQIFWIGHSRGGEGVVRAYDRVATGNYVPTNFVLSDIRAICSMAPTSFLASNTVQIGNTPYFLFVGASDTDVSGVPSNLIADSYPHFERAQGDKLEITIHGAGHADFHNHGGNCYCTGPALIGAAATHQVQFGYFLPWVKRYGFEHDLPSRDFFTRMADGFQPPGIPINVVFAKEFVDSTSAGDLMVDDFETQSSTTVSSSGANVTPNVADLVEGQMRDTDSSFVFTPAVPFNGMTRWRDTGDDPRCAVFDWDGTAPSSYEFDLPAANQDLTQWGALSFRACEGTRHPDTDAWNAPLSFSVGLVDTQGHTSSIDFGVYGALTRTYPRGGQGAGVGWANEFTSVRIALTDFQADHSQVDLKSVKSLRFDFGPSYGSTVGRIGLDDIAIIAKGN